MSNKGVNTPYIFILKGVDNMDNKEACKQDNALQRKLLRGEISEAEFNYRKKVYHEAYTRNESEILNKILKKYGGM